MPTIDQLTQAVAVADTDELPISQNGIANKATRAQIVAGLQPQLVVAEGQILGKASAGSGPPEAITIGSNLTLSAGILAANAQAFSIAALSPGVIPAAADTVGMGQGGGSVGVSLSNFVAGMAALPNADISGLGVTAAGTLHSRSLARISADAIAVEAFGAVGDGITDDSAAIAAAIASGRPVRLGPKVYVVNGQFTISTPNTVLLGTQNQTILRRMVQTGNGAWIAIEAGGFQADGIVFDGNKAAISTDSWGVLVTSSCDAADFVRCTFQNAAGPTLGSGLVFQASFPAVTSHTVQNCIFQNNTAHGVWVEACTGVRIEACRATGNGQYGIVADYNDQTFVQKVNLIQILGCTAWNNQRGIAVGNFNVPNTSPPVWGNQNPDAIAVLVANNICHDNVIYGIAASGRALAIQGNILSSNGTAANSGAGILANVSYSRIDGNTITGGALYGIDCGGSINSDISANSIDGAVLGVNCGGSANLRVSRNFVQECSSWAISVNNVETDGQGRNFNIACNNIDISDNWMSLPTTLAGGIQLRDGPQFVNITGNKFVGEAPISSALCLFPATDSVFISGNSWNFTKRPIANPYQNGTRQEILFPDIIDEIMVTYAPLGVQTMITNSQSSNFGQLTFIKVTSGGANYTTATVAVAGSGSGGSAATYISNGSVLGIYVVNAGTGYGPSGTTWPVTITGDGTGAAATAFAGIPLPDARRLRVHCNCPVLFTRVGSAPLQENWTAFDLTAPANSDVEWTAAYGMWRAGSFAASAYVASDGSGGTLLRSPLNGDVALHPNGRGRIRLSSDAEPYGCMSIIGRGSPEGTVVAPQGSDFRNLDGGVGTTCWIKRVGSDANGWFAIA